MKTLTKLAFFVALAFALNLLLIQALVFCWRALFSKAFDWSHVTQFGERVRQATEVRGEETP